MKGNARSDKGPRDWTRFCPAAWKRTPWSKINQISQDVLGKWSLRFHPRTGLAACCVAGPPQPNFPQLQRLLEDAGEIKGMAAFVYGCEVGCGAKDSMDFRTPPAARVNIECEVIYQQQDSAGYKNLDHALANRL